MLQPKKTKYKYRHKSRNTGLATKGNKVEFGIFGLKAVSRGRITARQIEAVRIVINRYFKRGVQVWIRVFPDKPITKKPLEVRQGKGKGNIEYWAAEVKPGHILFEMNCQKEEDALFVCKLAGAKLNIAISVTKRYVI